MSSTDLVLSSVSRLLGWTYTLAWSLSFYPQLITNYVNGSTVGLSSDFVVLNVLGHTSYLVYNAMLFFSPGVRREYQDRHQGASNVVQLNDVVFSSHATLLALLTFAQWSWYTLRSKAGRRTTRQPAIEVQGRQHISRTTTLVLAALSTVTVVGLGAKGVAIITWLDIANILAAFKLFITIVKYIVSPSTHPDARRKTQRSRKACADIVALGRQPQIKLNAERRSTMGFSIENILLDVTGGTLSLMQLFLDAAIEERHHRPGHRAKNWLANVLGDAGKLGLSVLTLAFDAVLLFQHYYLYRGQSTILTTSNTSADDQATSTDDVENSPSRHNHGTFDHHPPQAAPNTHGTATESTSLLRKKASNTTSTH